MKETALAWADFVSSQLSEEQANKLRTLIEAVCQKVAEKAMIIGYTRMLRRAIRRPEEADSPAKIKRCKEMLSILLEKTDSLCF